MNRAMLNIGVIVTMSILVWVVFYAAFFLIPAPEVVPELPPETVQVERVYTPLECTVVVSNYIGGDRVYGHGVLIKRNNQVFILTSAMIFTEQGDITIEWNEMVYGAELLDINQELGLVALQVDGFLPTVELNEFPSIPPGVPVVVDGREVNTLEYINADWVLLDGGLPIECTGMPVTQHGDIVGVIIGVNRVNQQQAIMAGNYALKTFADQVTLFEVPPLPINLDAPDEDIHQ